MIFSISEHVSWHIWQFDSKKHNQRNGYMHTSLHKLARKIRIPKRKDLKWEYGNLLQFTEKIFEIMMNGELQRKIPKSQI